MNEKKLIEKFNLTVSGYADFVGRETEVISEIVASAPTLKNLVPMTGIKANSSTDLNILSTDVTWTSGDCVATETGDNTVLKPRLISVKRLSDRELICLDKLDAKVPQLQAAGAMNDSLSFSDALINLKVAKNAKALEKLAWGGSLTGGTGNLALADGYCEIAKGETGSLAYYSTMTAQTKATIIDTIQTKVLDKRTDEMFENGATIYMSNAYASFLSQALIDKNLFHFGQVAENADGTMSFVYPGTNVKIVGTYGLNASSNLFCTIDGNLRFGTDMESDRETVEVFYDKYHKQLVSDIVFAAGFQYELASQVIFISKV
jgi:hypothetical protein